MDEKQTLPYGTWPSKITAESTGDMREFSELSWSGDGCLLWVERYSKHSSIMIWDPISGEIKNLSGEINVGGGIMYGGGSYTVCRDQVVFIEKKTHQIYLISGSNSESQLIESSPHPKSSPRISPYGTSLVYLESAEENDSIIYADFTQSQKSYTLDSSFDFYNYLRWHPDGTHLAWMAWNHPYMPWEEAHITLINLNPIISNISNNDTKLTFNEILSFPESSNNQEVTRNEPDIFPIYNSLPVNIALKSVCSLQPEFSPDGQSLAYLSDKTGWWQIYLLDMNNLKTIQLTKTPADHCLPPWLQNQCSYGFSSDNRRIYFIRNQLGFATLWQLNMADFTENLIQLDDEYTWLESLAVSPKEDQIALVASGGRTPPEIIITTPGGEYRVIRRAGVEETDQKLFSQPEAISWQDTQENTVHGLFYKPHNPQYVGDGKPPLLIIIHSGPTRQKYAEFQPRTQYFTSRGYAVLEINYRGSTGYGRDYWEALKGKWGVLEVEDVYQAAMALSDQGLVDRKRIALLGSSSGGLTVFQALVRYPGVFKAGISLYGIVNHLTLLNKQPKFERYYSEWLIGPYPEDTQLYEDRSPIFSAENIKEPLIIFQGGQDPIVPQDQAEQIIHALRENGVPNEYHLYADEGHSFKKSENVADFYQKTEDFLVKHMMDN